MVSTRLLFLFFGNKRIISHPWGSPSKHVYGWFEMGKGAYYNNFGWGKSDEKLVMQMDSW